MAVSISWGVFLVDMCSYKVGLGLVCEVGLGVHIPCMCIHTYVYIYTHIYTYPYIYIYIYISAHVCGCFHKWGGLLEGCFGRCLSFRANILQGSLILLQDAYGCFTNWGVCVCVCVFFVGVFTISAHICCTYVCICICVLYLYTCICGSTIYCVYIRGSMEYAPYSPELGSLTLYHTPYCCFQDPSML